MKGSNRYGNTRGSKSRRMNSKYISYQWAKKFNKNSLDRHYADHGRNVNYSNILEYEQHAIRFANTVDRKNCLSFIDRHGSTYKYNIKTNEFAIITKNGIIVTYFKPKEGYNYYIKQRKEVK